MTTQTEEPRLEVGQRWALDDSNEGEYTYFTITGLSEDRVLVGQRGWKPRATFGRRPAWIFCGHDGPGVLPPFTSSNQIFIGCMTASHPTVLPMDYPIDPGFGQVTITRDEDNFFSGYETEMTVADVEAWAVKNPGDWRIDIEGGLSQRIYQRQEAGWVLVAKGMGFA